MQKFCRIALAVSLSVSFSLSSYNAFAFDDITKNVWVREAEAILKDKPLFYFEIIHSKMFIGTTGLKKFKVITFVILITNIYK